MVIVRNTRVELTEVKFSAVHVFQISRVWCDEGVFWSTLSRAVFLARWIVIIVEDLSDGWCQSDHTETHCRLRAPRSCFPAVCDLSRPRMFFCLRSTLCLAVVVQRLLSDFGRPRRPKTPLASDDAAQLHERRAGELKRLGLRVQRPLSKVGRPSLQSLHARALAAQVRADPTPRGTSPTNRRPLDGSET